MAVGKDLRTAGVVTSWGHVVPLDHVIPFDMKYKMEPAVYLREHVTIKNIYNKYCSIQRH